MGWLRRPNSCNTCYYIKHKDGITICTNRVFCFQELGVDAQSGICDNYEWGDVVIRPGRKYARRRKRPEILTYKFPEDAREYLKGETLKD